MAEDRAEVGAFDWVLRFESANLLQRKPVDADEVDIGGLRLIGIDARQVLAIAEVERVVPIPVIRGLGVLLAQQDFGVLLRHDRLAHRRTLGADRSPGTRVLAGGSRITAAATEAPENGEPSHQTGDDPQHWPSSLRPPTSPGQPRFRSEQDGPAPATSENEPRIRVIADGSVVPERNTGEQGGGLHVGHASPSRTCAPATCQLLAGSRDRIGWSALRARRLGSRKPRQRTRRSRIGRGQNDARQPDRGREPWRLQGGSRASTAKTRSSKSTTSNPRS